MNKNGIITTRQEKKTQNENRINRTVHGGEFEKARVVGMAFVSLITGTDPKDRGITRGR